MSDDRAPLAPSPELVAALASDLTAAGFSVDGLGALWGEMAGAALLRDQPALARRALIVAAAEADRDEATAKVRRSLASLARLLVLGDVISAVDAAAALPSLGIDGAEALGLCIRRGDEIVPRIDLRPYAFADTHGEGQWWIASDLGELALGSALPEGHVLGVGGASLTLAGISMPGSDPAGKVLDLGTGCGIQALHARRHARHVIATDISPRALWFTEFNAALNGIDGIETRLGSMFEPVAGERFDAVISNPPFVITPRAEGVPSYEYRDGGLEGDAIVASFVSGVGTHLVPGGVAQLLGNWEYRDDEDGLDRVRSWVAASPVALDAWVVEREVQDAASYAETWIRDGGTLPGTPEFDALLEAWVRDFAVRGVTAVGFGYLLLRRPLSDTPTLARYERLAGPIAAPRGLGEHLRDALHEHDGQATLDDDALASARLVVAADVSEARHFRPGDDDPSVIELRQGGGFGRTIAVDPGLAALVGACDGELPVGVIISAIGQLMDASESELREELLPRVRELIDTGVLVFAPDGPHAP